MQRACKHSGPCCACIGPCFSRLHSLVHGCLQCTPSPAIWFQRSSARVQSSVPRYSFRHKYSQAMLNLFAHCCQSCGLPWKNPLRCMSHLASFLLLRAETKSASRSPIRDKFLLNWYRAKCLTTSQGTSNGFRPCVYNSGTDKGNYSKDTSVKVLWLIFWVVQQVWLVGFSSVMGQAMFPR